MLTIIAEFSILKENRVNFLNTIKELIEKSQKEKGCKEYSLFNDEINEENFVLIEKWKNQDSIDLHNDSEHFKAIVPKLEKLNNGKISVKIYESVDF